MAAGTAKTSMDSDEQSAQKKADPSPRKKKPGKVQIKINPAYCKGCGICAGFCPENVLEMRGGKAIDARPQDCTVCLQCEMRCPDFAISVERVVPLNGDE